jgi:GNAT superfamily N-acetyltransferase
MTSEVVAPGHRRRGVASVLLRRLVEWFGTQSAGKVCVNVDRDSGGAAPFYESRGARVLNEHWCVWDDVHALTR